MSLRSLYYNEKLEQQTAPSTSSKGGQKSTVNGEEQHAPALSTSSAESVVCFRRLFPSAVGKISPTSVPERNLLKEKERRLSKQRTSF